MKDDKKNKRDMILIRLMRGDMLILSDLEAGGHEYKFLRGKPAASKEIVDDLIHAGLAIAVDSEFKMKRIVLTDKGRSERMI